MLVPVNHQRHRFFLQGRGNATEKATKMAVAFDELKSSFDTQKEMQL
jgi:hypothetical protein